MTSFQKLSVSCRCHSPPGKEVGFLFLLAFFFNEELSPGLMVPAALETLCKVWCSSVLVSETFSLNRSTGLATKDS